MTEQQLALFFKYIDVTITAAIQHEIGGETKNLLELQDSFRKQLLTSVGTVETKLQVEQRKIEQAEMEAMNKGLRQFAKNRGLIP